MIVCPQWSVGLQVRDFYEKNSWIPSGFDFKRATLSPAGRIEDNLGKINEFKPDLIRGYGSYIGILFNKAHERGIPLHRPKAVLYGADQMTDHDRKLIEDYYGVPILSSFQSTELLRIAYQCERRQGFHINIDQVAVRIVDGNGCTLGPGARGEIVVSNLINRATVLLNYKLGDIVTLEGTDCPCGRTLPTLARIDGRTRDLIVLADGEILHALVFMPKLQSVPGVVRVQLMQHGVGHFTILAVCTVGTVWQETRQELEQVMFSQFGRETRVEIERVDTIRPDAGGKTRPFISECKP
jgi:phenylacetate-CoA ligase